MYMSNHQKLTVVCLAVGRIVIDDLHLLTADRELYRSNGTRKWEPPSEVIETLASDMYELRQRLEARNPNDSASLRFSIPAVNLAATTEWFKARRPDVAGSHELIIRHLAGNWHDDEPFLLHPGLIHASVTYAGWSTFSVSTPRPGPYPNQQTHYFVRVFDVQPQVKAIEAIRRALEITNSPLRLVAKDEIAVGQTTDDETISPLARHMVRPLHQRP